MLFGVDVCKSEGDISIISNENGKYRSKYKQEQVLKSPLY